MNLERSEAPPPVTLMWSERCTARHIQEAAWLIRMVGLEEQRCPVCYRPMHIILPRPEYGYTERMIEEAQRQLAKLCCSDACTALREFPETL